MSERAKNIIEASLMAGAVLAVVGLLVAALVAVLYYGSWLAFVGLMLALCFVPLFVSAHDWVKRNGRSYIK